MTEIVNVILKFGIPKAVIKSIRKIRKRPRWYVVLYPHFKSPRSTRRFHHQHKQIVHSRVHYLTVQYSIIDMFNLCLLNQGRKHECVDIVEVCERQIANLEHEIKIMRKHGLNTRLASRMVFMRNRLQTYIDEHQKAIVK